MSITKEVKLIELVKRIDFLYNVDSPFYKDTDRKEKAWNKIGKLLNIPGIKCKNKWKSMRDNYTKHKRKLSQEKTENGKPVAPYKYREQLSFLDDVRHNRCERKRTLSNPDESSEDSDTEIVSNVEIKDEIITPDPVTYIKEQIVVCDAGSYVSVMPKDCTTTIESEIDKNETVGPETKKLVNSVKSNSIGTSPTNAVINTTPYIVTLQGSSKSTRDETHSGVSLLPYISHPTDPNIKVKEENVSGVSLIPNLSHPIDPNIKVKEEIDSGVSLLPDLSHPTDDPNIKVKEEIIMSDSEACIYSSKESGNLKNVEQEYNRNIANKEYNRKFANTIGKLQTKAAIYTIPHTVVSQGTSMSSNADPFTLQQTKTTGNVNKTTTSSVLQPPPKKKPKVDNTESNVIEETLEDNSNSSIEFKLSPISYDTLSSSSLSSSTSTPPTPPPKKQNPDIEVLYEKFEEFLESATNVVKENQDKSNNSTKMLFESLAKKVAESNLTEQQIREIEKALCLEVFTKVGVYMAENNPI